MIRLEIIENYAMHKSVLDTVDQDTDVASGQKEVIATLKNGNLQHLQRYHFHIYHHVINNM